MINRGNSQLLNNLNGHQFGDQLVIDNQIQGIVSNLSLINNLFLQPFKNKIGNGNIYLNINRNFPQLQYQNQNQKNNLGELDETNFLDLLRNLSLEPSNQKLNNIPLIDQSILGMKNTMGIGHSQMQQPQQPWAGGANRNNNLNNLNNLN